jgi:hypothetical protein
MGPPPSHQLDDNFPNILWYIPRHGGIARSSQASQFRHMPAARFFDHLKNIGHSKASIVLVLKMPGSACISPFNQSRIPLIAAPVSGYSRYRSPSLPWDFSSSRRRSFRLMQKCVNFLKFIVNNITLLISFSLLSLQLHQNSFQISIIIVETTVVRLQNIFMTVDLRTLCVSFVKLRSYPGISLLLHVAQPLHHLRSSCSYLSPRQSKILRKNKS